MIPHEYHNALDALPSFVAMDSVRWVCGSAELRPLLQARLSSNNETSIERKSVVWVEPQVGEGVPEAGERLIVIASLPLMRLVPERRGWGDAPMGGWRVKKMLRRAGWGISAEYRFHTLTSILLNTLAGRMGQTARADRWRFAARLRYIGRPPLPGTLALTVWNPRS